MGRSKAPQWQVGDDNNDNYVGGDHEGCGDDGRDNFGFKAEKEFGSGKGGKEEPECMGDKGLNKAVEGEEAREEKIGGEEDSAAGRVGRCHPLFGDIHGG